MTSVEHSWNLPLVTVRSPIVKFTACKYCRNNQSHSPYYVLAHLTRDRGMSPGYILWYMHGETTINGAVLSWCSSHVATDAAASSTEQGEDTE